MSVYSYANLTTFECDGDEMCSEKFPNSTMFCYISADSDVKYCGCSAYLQLSGPTCGEITGFSLVAFTAHILVFLFSTRVSYKSFKLIIKIKNSVMSTINLAASIVLFLIFIVSYMRSIVFVLGSLSVGLRGNNSITVLSEFDIIIYWLFVAQVTLIPLMWFEDVKFLKSYNSGEIILSMVSSVLFFYFFIIIISVNSSDGSASIPVPTYSLHNS